MNTPIKRALISVYDKTGVVDLATYLDNMGVEILSTGGTAKKLQEAGIKVIEVSDYTGFPEMMDGRVKTLHPKIHGGLLQLRDNPKHLAQAREHDIKPIDLVVVNLYPFEETVARPGVTHEEIIEQIDIGGPSMLRSGAKNYQSVAVVVNPKDYAELIKQMRQTNGCTTLDFRKSLAEKTFFSTAKYDRAIEEYLNRDKKPTPEAGSYGHTS